MADTSAQIAANITALLQSWNTREAQLKDWMAGAVDGGPNGDGKFPLTDASGNTYLTPSLLKLQDLVGGPAGLSTQAQLLAEAARDLALGYRDTAGDYSATALSARDAAVSAKDLALVYKNDVAADRAAVEAIQLDLDAINTNVTALWPQIEADAASAHSDAIAADASATRAASYDVTAMKGAPNGLATLDSAGQLPFNQIPAIALIDTYTAASQAEQLGLVTQRGDVCVRTDENKSYIRNSGTTGTMSDWTLLRTPIDAVLSVNGRVGAVDLSDLFAALSHTHTIANVTGLQTALDGKAALVHTHVIADVTGLQTALDGKQAAGSYVTSVNGAVKAAGSANNSNLWFTDDVGGNQGIIFWDRAGDILTLRRFATDGSTPQGELQVINGGINVNGTVLNLNGAALNAANGLLKLDGNGKIDTARLTNVPIIGGDGGMEVGNYIDFHSPTADGADFKARIQANSVGDLTLDPTSDVAYLWATQVYIGGGSANLMLQHDGSNAYIRTQPGKGMLVLGANNNNSIWINADGTVTSGYQWNFTTTQTFTAANNQIIMKFGTASNPSLIFRNDGSTFYMLKTAASTAPSGTWDTTRPFMLDLTSGNVTIGTSLTVSGTTYVHDIVADRGDGTGVIYFGNQGNSHYCYWDNSWYHFNNGAVHVNGQLQVDSAATILGTLYANTPNNGTTGGIQLRANGTTGNAYFQIANSAASAQWGYWLHQSTGNADWNGTAGLKDNGGRVLSWTGSRAGGKCTISTAAPSGGADGDVWFKV